MRLGIEFGPPERRASQMPLVHDAQKCMAQAFADARPDATEIIWDYIIPGSTIVAAHIAEVPAQPEFSYIAWVWQPETEDIVKAGQSNTGGYAAEKFESSMAEQGMGADQSDEMPIKQVCLVRKRHGLSRREFIEYYETSHAPLAARHLPMIASYSRTYLCSDGAQALGIDAVTEIGFRNDDDHAAFHRSFEDEMLGRLFACDEEHLFDRDSIAMFMACGHRIRPAA
jgi:hypothetical protein